MNVLILLLWRSIINFHAKDSWLIFYTILWYHIWSIWLYLYCHIDLYPYILIEDFIHFGHFQNGNDHYISTISCKVFGIVLDIVMHPSGRGESKREVKSVICYVYVNSDMLHSLSQLFPAALKYCQTQQRCWRHPLPVLQAGILPPGCNYVPVNLRFRVLGLRGMRRPWGLDATYQGLTVPFWEITGLNVHFHQGNHLHFKIFFMCLQYVTVNGT